MVFYSIGDIERSLKIMYPTESILHRQTMYRYYDKEDCIPEEFKKFEMCKSKKNYYLTREGIILMVKDYNVGKRKEVDLDILLEYVDRIANGEEISIENDVKTIYQKLKDAEKELQAKEEELKRKSEMIEKLKIRINDFEEHNTKLLTDGKTKDEKLKNLEEEVDKQKAYQGKMREYQKKLIDYENDKEVYDNTNFIMRKIKKIKKPERPIFIE